MSLKVKDLCRLCARKHEISKDLLDENNRSVLDIIRQFTQITVTECDDMPTKVCLDCEEKLVTFQLFVLECYKVQDCLRKLCLEQELSIKTEDNATNFDIEAVKSEVKDEISVEDILSGNLHNDMIELHGSDIVGDDYLNEDSNDEMDVAIATLKASKVRSAKVVKKKEISEQEAAEFKELLKKPDLKAEDFVKLDCTFCNEQFKSWPQLSVHFIKVHKSKPILYCLCGYAIKSKGVLYKHVSDHKAESRKLKKDIADGSEDNKVYTGISVRDFVSFQCPICDKMCSSWYSLKAHSERVHATLPMVKCKCGVMLKSKSVMYKHIQDHKSPSTLSCDQCAKVMKSMEALEKHKLKHIPKSERKFCCGTCNRVFNNKELLRSHEKSHIPIDERKVFSCDICNLKFTTRSSAASHRRVVHEKVKSYVCDLCGYACGTNGELRQHRAIHSDEKPFVCRKCGKPFKTYSNLKTHMDIHEDTSYTCYVCGRVLNSRRTLRKHLLVHEDKCRHVCSYCNKAFKRQQTLKVHMYTHTGDKPLSCKWCDERFSYASTLRSHRLRCHPDKMTASLRTTYTYTTTHVPHIPAEEYIKSDLAAIGLTKNEVETVVQ